MILVKTSWRKWLANGLLALALVASHALPMPTSMAAAQPGHHPQTMAGMDGGDGHHHHAGHNPGKSLPGAVACHFCPGMAIFPPEAMTVPSGAVMAGYAQTPDQSWTGISLSLDTPPPKSRFVA